jgi:hypothetical protein
LGAALAVCGSALALLAAASPATATPAPAARGYDISYPQCGSPFPKGQTFGLVGVNGGVANNANKCAAGEVKWAASSPGLTRPPQAPASLYINTADPGPGVSDWPHSGSSEQYGRCHGRWSKACAFVYGEQRAAYSYGLVSAHHPVLASTAPWWLDIETVNSWASRRALNIAAIRGFIEGLVSAGAPAPVGVYSSAAEWRAITGLNSHTSRSALGSSPPSWIVGGGTVADAERTCRSVAFTGIKPTLAQYSHGRFDGDLRCK